MKNKPLEPGTWAPDLTLKDTPDQTLSLSEFKGMPVVLIFYPADFSPVCSDELAVFNELLPMLQKNFGATVLGISVDNAWCHMAFIKDRRLRFPLLADFHPKGDVARLYHAYREEDGEAERALYVIGPDGTVVWSYIAPIGINPGADGVLKALEGLHGKNKKPAAAGKAQ